MNSIKKLADAIYNDITSGLRGYHLNPSLSKELLELEIVEMRLAIIKEYFLKGILPIEDLLASLNCVPVDCDTLDKCSCGGISCSEPTAHFEIPQLLLDFGLKKTIKYIGSSDKKHPFLFYTSGIDKVGIYLKYRKRGKSKPWVYIDITPNHNGLLDCYIFNAPLIKLVSVIAVFKDPRLMEDYLCDCYSETLESLMDANLNFIDIAVKDRLTLQKLKYYRQFAAPILPNDLKYIAG